jgi:methyltransferase
VIYYLALIVAVGVERVAELLVSKSNLRRSLRSGGHELGAGHYPFMVLLHSGLLVGCLIEGLHRSFIPALGWPMLAVVLGAQGLRWWCIRSLGWRWNTRIVVVPGLALVTSGPYRWLRHPNYLAVVLEGLALPLLRSCWITAIVFTLCNAALLRVRIAAENSALAIG